MVGEVLESCPWARGSVEANLLPVFRRGTAPGLKPYGNIPPDDWEAGCCRGAGCSAFGLGMVSAFFMPPIGGGGGGGGGAPVSVCQCVVCASVPNWL